MDGVGEGNSYQATLALTGMRAGLAGGGARNTTLIPGDACVDWYQSVGLAVSMLSRKTAPSVTTSSASSTPARI
jgi:hypothetical protein